MNFPISLHTGLSLAYALIGAIYIFSACVMIRLRKADPAEIV